MSDFYFATGYVRLLYRYVRAEQVAAATLFEGLATTEADLLRADFEMPFAEQMQLCRHALRSTKPGLGLRVGHQLQLAAHGPLGIAMQSADTLATALGTFVDLVAMRASIFSLSMETPPAVAGLESQSREVRVIVETKGLDAELKPFFSEALLFSLTNCFDFFAGQSQGLYRLELGYPQPSYGADYVGVFGARVSFDCERTLIAFDRQHIKLASPEADVEAFEDAIRRCRAHMQRQAGSLADDVERFLLENPGKLWGVEEVAVLFSMSARTLIRRLKSDGLTYQGLRDEALKSQAVIYLKSMSVEATAMALGFADTSSFRRTFKRWFGVPPSVYTVRSDDP